LLLCELNRTSLTRSETAKNSGKQKSSVDLPRKTRLDDSNRETAAAARVGLIISRDNVGAGDISYISPRELFSINQL